MSLRRALFPLLALLGFVSPSVSALYIVFVPLAILWVADGIRRRQLSARLRLPAVYALGLYAFFSLLSALFSADPAYTLPKLRSCLLYLIVPITADLVDSPDSARRLLGAIGAGGVLQSLIGFWQFAHGGNDLGNRIRGTGHYMTFSGITLIAGCVLLAFLLEEKGRRRLTGALAVLPLGAMLLTFTRNAYVGFVGALVAYCALRRPRGLLLLPPLIAAVLLASPPEIRDRITSIGDLRDHSTRDRVEMAKAGAAMIRDHPLWGVGPDMVHRVYDQYRTSRAVESAPRHLHNNLIQIAAQTGIPSALAYLALVVLVVVAAARGLRRATDPEHATAWAASLLVAVAVTVAGIFEFNFSDKEVLVPTLILVAFPFTRFLADGRDARPAEAA